MIGTGTLAIAPVIATPPDVKIVNPAVQRSKSPLENYVETVREALENLEALLGSALALPSPAGWTLELALNNLLNDPDADVQLFVDQLEARGPLAGASVPALLEGAAGELGYAVDQAAAGNIELAIVSLMRTFATLAPVVADKSLNAVTGPVLSGIGSTAVAIRNIVNALDDAEPGSGELLGALIAAPATVVDGVLNGFSAEPGTAAFPGLPTPRDPLDPTEPDPAATTNSIAPDANRAVTLEVNPGPGGAEIVNPNAATNASVMSDAAGADAAQAQQRRPRLFGGDSTTRGAPGAGLNTLRQGIREGISDFRTGIRDAVKTVTGRDDDRGGTTGDTAESP
ncbi:hypothetical protein [Mycolicibacterium sp. 120270]|uniref:hypothetical protein n=1 Tax=Mycolicibacterium sp. 120270 TaxID=3090600 RepID=UPI00299F22A3|nr:hypothetical protein [Mycolicibacterium sp. 120270]MDX1884172.1 hypothetical protein [Mycolicibacterium sp. 120270]